jgi:hypothetical protein
MHGLQQPQRVFEVLDRFTLPWSADTEKEPDDLPGTR